MLYSTCKHNLSNIIWNTTMEIMELYHTTRILGPRTSKTDPMCPTNCETNSRRELEPNSNKQYNKAIYYQRVIQSDLTNMTKQKPPMLNSCRLEPSGPRDGALACRRGKALSNHAPRVLCSGFYQKFHPTKAGETRVNLGAPRITDHGDSMAMLANSKNEKRKTTQITKQTMAMSPNILWCKSNPALFAEVSVVPTTLWVRFVCVCVSTLKL